MSNMLYVSDLDNARDKLATLESLHKEAGNFLKSLLGAIATGQFTPAELKWPMGNASDARDDLCGMVRDQQDAVDRMELQFQSRPRRRFEASIDAAE